jgi:hypothetical protein
MKRKFAYIALVDIYQDGMQERRNRWSDPECHVVAMIALDAGSR